MYWCGVVTCVLVWNYHVCIGVELLRVKELLHVYWCGIGTLYWCGAVTCVLVWSCFVCISVELLPVY